MTTQDREEYPPEELLVDVYSPRSEFTVEQHIIAHAPAGTTYRAARELDFTEVHGGLVSLLMRLRDLPRRWHERKHGVPRQPTRMTIDDLAAGSAWVILGERAGSEFAVGVVGKFWKPVIEWLQVEPEDFTAFDKPDYGKIVMSISVAPYGPHRSLLTVETRVVMTDPDSWLKFRRYWRTTCPFIKSIHSALAKTIAEQAAQRTFATSEDH